MVSRRSVLLGVAAGGVALGVAAPLVPPHWPGIALGRLIPPDGPPEPLDGDPFLPPSPWAQRLIKAAESQIGKTVTYDPAYVRLAYPMGDIPLERGVCTDVIIRAYRDAFSVDLQQLVHEDMRAAFAAYPNIWGLRAPDRNIDHRRVPNLERFFQRRGAALPVTENSGDYQPGDIITSRVGNRPHIAIVTHRKARGDKRPLIVHNLGAGTRLEDGLFDFPLKGHFRFIPRFRTGEPA